MAENKKRLKLFVDPKVQGALVGRILLYWVCYTLTVAIMVLAWRILYGGPARIFYLHFDDLWFKYGAAVVACLLLVPLMALDVLRVSNRFVGPMLRLRRGIRQLAQGQHVEPIRFREGDFWHGFAEDFNALLVRLQGPPAKAQAKTELYPAEEPDLAKVGAK
ncbi:MAG: hypothetical protein HY000_39455 [Planctomycetes bacterium]|nr:hypothetical protein [Planctomycetota bacterium]